MSSRSLVVFLAFSALLSAQDKIAWTETEKPIVDQLHKLRHLSEEQRPIATKQLAFQIRQLPAGSNRKVGLANELANLATEGDPGHGTLQEVATTLAQSLAEQPPAARENSSTSYMELAQLVRYEHVQLSSNVSSDNPEFAAAMSKLEATDRRRETADFTLTDLKGKSWTLKDLPGKVVLVNFWATWCPPCRAEMPDLDKLYRDFQEQGLVILAISDEQPDKVNPFIAQHTFSYPILLDPGRKVNDLFEIEGIPRSFLYDRNGHLVAQAMDMRTRGQFLEMLALAGMK